MRIGVPRIGHAVVLVKEPAERTVFALVGTGDFPEGRPLCPTVARIITGQMRRAFMMVSATSDIDYWLGKVIVLTFPAAITTMRVDSEKRRVVDQRPQSQQSGHVGCQPSRCQISTRHRELLQFTKVPDQIERSTAVLFTDKVLIRFAAKQKTQPKTGAEART